MAIVEWDDDQMDVEQAATDTDADAHVKEWHALSTPVAGERKRPNIVVVQDIR